MDGRYGTTTVNNSEITINAGSGLVTGGSFTLNQASDVTITIDHADTSTQLSIDNSAGNVIQDIELDGFGHVTGGTSINLDGRYYTETESDTRFVNVSGDTMTGALTISSGGLTISAGGATITGNVTLNDALLIGSSILDEQSNTDVDTGTETVAQISSTTYDAAFFDFVIKSGTNLRAGTVYAVHDGTSVEFTETSTEDLGNTTDVTLSVDLSGGNIRLRATTTSNNWTVKSLVRGL